VFGIQELIDHFRMLVNSKDTLAAFVHQSFTERDYLVVEGPNQKCAVLFCIDLHATIRFFWGDFCNLFSLCYVTVLQRVLSTLCANVSRYLFIRKFVNKY
jgi:hypothetical protein